MLFKIGMPSVRPHPDAGRRTQKGGFFVSEANSAATHTPYGLAKNEVDTPALEGVTDVIKKMAIVHCPVPMIEY